MKFSLAASTTLCTIVSLTCVPLAEANHGVRADLPCPYGGGGIPANPSQGEWIVGSGASPFNTGVSGAATVMLNANMAVINPVDEVGQTFTGAFQYDTYAVAPNTTAGFCDSNNPPIVPEPGAQVIEYTLAAGTATQGATTVAIAAGDLEVEFNYDATQAFVTTAAGPASFIFGGVTYTSTGAGVPFVTDNGFLFNASGAFLGAIDEDSNGNTTLANALPTGWNNGSGGGGGTMSAPEIDCSSAIAGLSLLAGGLAVVRGGRRLIRAQ